MSSNEQLPDDDFDALEADLKALRPRAPSAGFADRAAVESRLRDVSPRDPSSDFADRVVVEGVLRDLTPISPEKDFADRVVLEGRLRELAPRDPSAGFADRVVAACLSEGNPRRNILTFPRALAPLAAAAALALFFAPALIREKTGAREKILAEASVTTHAAPETEPVVTTGRPESPAPVLAESGAPEIPEEALHLPVIDLGDGRAFRPVLRARPAQPADFRAMPGGAVVPVSFSAGHGVDYEPVDFE